MNLALVALLTLQTVVSRPNAPTDDPPAVCDSCAEWNRPRTPFKLHGNSFYVGVEGLSAVAISTREGLILLDGGLPQSAPLIEANLRSLGFDVKDVRLIVNSHAHYDHAGGIARLQRDSGAAVAASPEGAAALRSGRPVPSDPQFGADGADGVFPAVRDVKVIKDGETLRVGEIELKAHFTPGHTPGSTTWTWRSCEGATCLNLVYADSLTAISSDGFRFLGDGTKAHPDLSASFRASIETIRALPCDLMLSTHPGSSRLFERLARRVAASGPDPLVDTEACRTYAANASRALEERLKTERAGRP